MSKIIKFSFLIIFLAGLLLLDTNNVFACSCITPPFEEMFEGSTAVFEGTVLNIETPENEYSVDPVKVTFHVRRVWKGESQDTIVVYTEHQSTACRYAFGNEPGKTYLVYAYEDEGRLSTNGCTRTQLRSHAFGDLFRLTIKIHRFGVSAVVASMVLIGVSALVLRRKQDGE